jgi:hypothetical protein
LQKNDILDGGRSQVKEIIWRTAREKEMAIRKRTAGEDLADYLFYQFVSILHRGGTLWFSSEQAFRIAFMISLTPAKGWRYTLVLFATRILLR